jgi:HAD superfamily hydrolase (TIGR01509 family)
MRNVKLVAFDIGGVIVRICRTWHDVFAITGIEPDAGLIDSAEWIKQVNVEFECGRISHDELIERAAGYADHCTPEQVAALVDAWLIEPYADVDGIIANLKSAAVHTACLSNTNERHWHLMTEADPRFAHIPSLDTHIASHRVGVMKPDAGIYEALEAATDLRGDQIVFFDDLDANIAAARSRGWHAHEIDPHGHPAEQITAHLEALHVL